MNTSPTDRRWHPIVPRKRQLLQTRAIKCDEHINKMWRIYQKIGQSWVSAQFVGFCRQWAFRLLRQAEWRQLGYICKWVRRSLIENYTNNDMIDQRKNGLFCSDLVWKITAELKWQNTRAVRSQFTVNLGAILWNWSIPWDLKLPDVNSRYLDVTPFRKSTVVCPFHSTMHLYRFLHSLSQK